MLCAGLQQPQILVGKVTIRPTTQPLQAVIVNLQRMANEIISREDTGIPFKELKVEESVLTIELDNQEYKIPMNVSMRESDETNY